jgi:RecB family exonuclease
MHAECAIQDGGVFCDVCYVTRKEDTPKMTFTIPDVIRRTYIETYRKCPHKFFKEVLERNVQPPTSYTQIGIDLHEIFESACKGIETKEDALRIMQQKFDGYSDTLFDSGFASDNRTDMWTRTIESIGTFFDVTLPSLPAVPFTTEETIEFSVGEELPNVQFTMDRIDEVDGELEMHDWKTGRVMVGQKLSSDLQAPLYIYGTRQHFGKPVRSFTFYYLQDNKTRVFVRDELNPDIYVCKVNKREYKVSLKSTIAEIQHVFSQIKNGNFNIPQNTKGMHFTCKICHLLKEGKCQGADLQSWNQAKEGKYAWN